MGSAGNGELEGRRDEEGKEGVRPRWVPAWAGQQVAKELAGMTPDEEAAFWHKRFLATKRHQAARRRGAKTA
jgi:hypothetical protein